MGTVRHPVSFLMRSISWGSIGGIDNLNNNISILEKNFGPIAIGTRILFIHDDFGHDPSRGKDFEYHCYDRESPNSISCLITSASLDSVIQYPQEVLGANNTHNTVVIFDSRTLRLGECNISLMTVATGSSGRTKAAGSRKLRQLASL